MLRAEATDRSTGTDMTKTLRPLPAPFLAAALAAAMTAALTLTPAPLLAQTEAPAETPAEPAPGEPYLVAEHRDWQVLCTRFEAEGPEICEMYQLLTEEGGQPVAEISIAALAEDGDIVAGATITTPLETFLPAGLGFRIGADAEEMRIEAFRVCTVVGCVVRMGLTSAEVNEMQRGAEAFVTIVPFVAVDQPVDLRISLMGFTAAINEVRERTPNPPALEMPPVAPAMVDPSQPPATPPAAQD